MSNDSSATSASAKSWRKSGAPKASSLLASELRTRIVRNGMEDGEPFPSELEIIASSGYSRATVREAMRLLESDGLIVTRRGPGGGVRVGRPDLTSAAQSIAVHLATSNATLGDMFAYRRPLEREAARLAALNATVEQRAQLERHIAVNDTPVEDIIDFHSLVANATGNEFFRSAMQVLLSVAVWHTPYDGLSSVDLRDGEAAHAKVVRGIIARDPDAAAEAMDAHLAAYEDIIRKRGDLDRPVIRAGDWDRITRNSPGF